MTKRKKYIVIGIAIIICIFGTVIWNNPYNCSKRITNSVEKGSIEKLNNVLEKNKKGINYPYFKYHIFTILLDRNYCPIHYACLTGNVEKVELLLKSGADPNIIDPTIHTSPLLFVLQSGEKERFEIARLLIKYGADINYVNARRECSLFESLISVNSDSAETKQQGYEMFVFLINNCESYEDPNGQSTILEQAVAFENMKAVEYILNNNIQSVNEQSDTGNTALMRAAMDNNIVMCRYLLSCGADKSIQDVNGKTAFDYAMQFGFSEIAKLCN